LSKLARVPYLQFFKQGQSASFGQYTFAILAVAVAAVVRYALGVYVGLTPPFVLFYPAVLLVCLFAGIGPSLVATFLSVCIAEVFFISHAGARAADHVPQLVIPAVFCTLCVVSSGLLDAVRRRSERALRVGEDRYRDLVEHSEDLLCTHDLEGQLLTVNPAPARILGYSVEELLKIPMRSLIIPEGREEFARYLERLQTTGQPEHGLLCVICKSGEVRTWEYRNTLRTEGVNKPIVRGMAHDVTERRRAELALKESEQRERARAQELQTVLDTLPIPVLTAHDPQCLNITANRAGYERLGLPPGSNLSLSVAENRVRFHFRRGGVQLSKAEMPMSLAVSTGLPQRGIPTTLVLADGTERHELGNAAPLLDAHGKPRGAVSAAVDVTEQVRAEEALRKSEEHFRLLVEQAPNGIFLVDFHGNFLAVNPACAEILGYTRDEVLRLSIADMVGPEEIERVPRELQALNEKGTLRTEWKVRRKDGSFFSGEVFGRLLSDGHLQGILRDITDRKRAEDILRQNEERFRVALKDSPITVFNQDRELRYTWIYNPRFCWQGEILGKTDDDLLGAEKARPLRELKRKVIDSGAGVREEVIIRQNEKNLSFDTKLEPLFDSQGKIAGITGALMDIARLRELADNLESAKEQLVREKTYLEREIHGESGFETIIGQSPALCEVLNKARVVAPIDSSVLLLGETGTGKELVARSIHSLSPRHDRNFIKLNCAAVPTGLLESELFGHEKGAFTGAVAQKVGRLELADKGTLLLDEVGDLPLELQPKLLRVLQDREFERLGGVRTLHVDVRIIAATNRDLRAEVAAKKFREDLFYRLNVFPIELPPLRQRRGDIEKLVHHFLKKYSSRMGKRIEAIPEETMSVLENWNWPGNVRELENMIERMVILTKGRVLGPPPIELYSPPALPEESLTELERDHIIRILRETNGVLAGANGAASRLGLKRTTLQSMLKRFNIEPQDFRGVTGTLGPE
jgi:formate hydrogenlyase transcriptional activator